jgi:hypothetical protein
VIPHGRWSECWQFLADYPGTPGQQQAVLDAFRLEYGTEKHRLFQRLDRSINQVYKRSYLTFGFVPQEWFAPNQIAVAGPTGINLSDLYAPEAVGDQALHELGHVVDMHFLTAATRLQFMALAGIDPNLNTWNRNVQETFADAGRDWCKGGWKSLTPILLPD